MQQRPVLNNGGRGISETELDLLALGKNRSRRVIRGS